MTSLGVGEGGLAISDFGAGVQTQRKDTKHVKSVENRNHISCLLQARNFSKSQGGRIWGGGGGVLADFGSRSGETHNFPSPINKDGFPNMTSLDGRRGG